MDLNKKMIVKTKSSVEVSTQSLDMKMLRETAGQLPKLIKKNDLVNPNQNKSFTNEDIKNAFYPIIEQSGAFKLIEEIGDDLKYLYISKKILKVRMRRNEKQLEQVYNFNSGKLLKNNNLVDDKKSLAKFFDLASKLFNSVEKESVQLSKVT